MSIFRGMHIPPRRVVVWHVVSAIPLAIVVVLGGYLSYHYHALSVQSRERVDRAYEVLDGVNGLIVAVQDAELAQSDFIITGNEADLAPVGAALRLTGERGQRLHELLLESPEQLRRLSDLESSIAARLAELGNTISLRKRQGFEAARVVVAQGQDKRAMYDMRQRASSITTAEHQLLSSRQEARRGREQDIFLIGVFIAALSVTTRLAIAWFLARLRKRGKEISLPV